MSAIRVNPSGFTRSFPFVSDELLDMKVDVTNGSNEAVSSVSIGVAFFAPNDACPSSYAETHILHVEISPGESRTDAVQLSDAALAKRHVCIAVIDVELVTVVSNTYRTAPTQNRAGNAATGSPFGEWCGDKSFAWLCRK